MGLPDKVVKTLAIFGLSALIAELATLPKDKQKKVQDLIDDGDIESLKDIERLAIEDKESKQKPDEKSWERDKDGQYQQKREEAKKPDEDDEERKLFERLKLKYGTEKMDNQTDPKFFTAKY